MNLIKKPIKHVYFESKLNRQTEEKFIIYESIIGFNHQEFRLRIIDELNFLGMQKEELAQSCYIGSERLKSLLLNKMDFLPSEISEISKRLGMI